MAMTFQPEPINQPELRRVILVKVIDQEMSDESFFRWLREKMIELTLEELGINRLDD